MKECEVRKDGRKEGRKDERIRKEEKTKGEKEDGGVLNVRQDAKAFVSLIC